MVAAAGHDDEGFGEGCGGDCGVGGREYARYRVAVVVVAEVSDGEKLQERTEIASEIRTEILAELGVTPRVVYIVPPRWVVKSTAGKPARSTNREKFLKEDNW